MARESYTRRRALSLMGTAGLAALAGCTSLLGASTPHIEAPSSALIDEPLDITLEGFQPDTKVTVRATAHFWKTNWESHATFRTDVDGTVDLSKQQPLSGTYSSVDGMGLFWSMSPQTQTETVTPTPTTTTRSGQTTPKPIWRNQKHTVQLRATSDGTTRASTEITRRTRASGVTVQTVDEDGLVGRFYEPSGNGPHPGMVALHGSGGIPLDGQSALLASHGYATLAIQYFGTEGLSSTLSEIPLEYFTIAMEWVTDHEIVTDGGIGLLGASRGGELALLLSSRETTPKIKTVIAYVPSAYVFFSNYGGTSAWAVNGEPIPYIPLPPVIPRRFTEDGKQILRPVYRKAVEKADTERKKKATIPFENIDGSVVLISGKDDAMWPSTPFSRKVVERLDKYGHPKPYKHLSYENAGHHISYPYIPTTGSTATETFALGGTPAANAHAAADSWPRILNYLEKAFDSTAHS